MNTKTSQLEEISTISFSRNIDREDASGAFDVANSFDKINTFHTPNSLSHIAKSKIFTITWGDEEISGFLGENGGIVHFILDNFKTHDTIWKTIWEALAELATILGAESAVFIIRRELSYMKICKSISQSLPATLIHPSSFNLCDYRWLVMITEL